MYITIWSIVLWSAVLSSLAYYRESEDSSSQVGSVENNKLYWGLSASSCNLAKDLLAEPQVNPTESDYPLLPLNSSSTSCPSSLSPSTKQVVVYSPDKTRHLSQSQSVKLRKLLLKIQDERLCQVCMSAVLSAVFCPCGHHVACYRCAKRLCKCPICRQPIGYVQYVYSHWNWLNGGDYTIVYWKRSLYFGPSVQIIIHCTPCTSAKIITLCTAYFCSSWEEHTEILCAKKSYFSLSSPFCNNNYPD